MSEEPLHVAQKSRRDKLRHQFVSDNENPNHEFAFNSEILDYSTSNAPQSSSSYDWIMNCSGASLPLFPPHIYPENQQNMSYENTLQAMIAPSCSNSLGGANTDHGGYSIDGKVGNLSRTQGLSLSLSSKPNIEYVGASNWPNPSKLLMDSRSCVGPLGPFTGYATILKSSKFLKPAQQLLDDFCNAVIGSNNLMIESNSEAAASSIFGEERDGSGTRSCIVGGQGADIQQIKVKLLYMQDEVCRRYKQYHQQMQMVVSSFESVPGLSTATPYTSLALKAVSRQFRHIKHAISNQLQNMSKMLGEEYFMSTSPTSSSRGENTPRLKHVDHQSLRRQKRNEINTSIGYLENNQPVWRPQRGLPERAVSVLRAWLFEHFLHPYPNDSDKHMLASQTGLTRNQVSNWFINARVRLWKPMVEEIHMLETKGVSGMDLNNASKRNTRKSIITEGDPEPESQSNNNKTAIDYSRANNNELGSNINPMDQQWHQEKRLRLEDREERLLSFAYHGSMDMSLTLGLGQNDDPQHQHQQMVHFGGQMLHDFVG